MRLGISWNILIYLGDLGSWFCSVSGKECGPNGKNSAGCYARFPGCGAEQRGMAESCKVWHGVIQKCLIMATSQVYAYLVYDICRKKDTGASMYNLLVYNSN